jgi:hypothetical protein
VRFILTADASAGFCTQFSASPACLGIYQETHRVRPLHKAEAVAAKPSNTAGSCSVLEADDVGRRATRLAGCLRWCSSKSQQINQRHNRVCLETRKRRPPPAPHPAHTLERTIRTRLCVRPDTTCKTLDVSSQCGSHTKQHSRKPWCWTLVMCADLLRTLQSAAYVTGVLQKASHLKDGKPLWCLATHNNHGTGHQLKHTTCTPKTK